MAWCQPGNKPLSEPMMVRFLMYIYITRPQWIEENPFIQVSMVINVSVYRNIDNHRNLDADWTSETCFCGSISMSFTTYKSVSPLVLEDTETLFVWQCSGSVGLWMLSSWISELLLSLKYKKTFFTNTFFLKWNYAESLCYRVATGLVEKSSLTLPWLQTQIPVLRWFLTWSFDVFLDLGLNQQLSKQSRRWWFERLPHSLWLNCNGQ